MAKKLHFTPSMIVLPKPFELEPFSRLAMANISFKTIASAVVLFSTFSLTAQAQTRRLCVNGSSQVFARANCLAAERIFTVSPDNIATPSPTATAAPSSLNLSTCRKVSSRAASNVGVATASFQCDTSNEFVLEYGFTTSDGFKTDASVRQDQLLYTATGQLPVGAVVTMEGSRARNYNLTLTGTCCKR
jgi:hypothetical protein